MNICELDQDNNKTQEPQIVIELDGTLIQLPLTRFNNILEREITDYILKNETNQKDIIDLNDLVNVQCWKTKYKDLEIQVRVFESIISRFKRDLKHNPLAQPLKCSSASVNQNVNVTSNLKNLMTMKDSKNYNMKYETFTISDSEDDVVIITDTPKIKSIQTENKTIIDLADLDKNTQNLKDKYKSDPKSKTNCKSVSEDDVVIITDTSKIKPVRTYENENIIAFIDLDNDTQNLEVINKPASKSKTNVSIPDLKTNVNDKVQPINTEVSKTLSNGKCLSTSIRKRKPGPKSKTMFVGDIVPFNAENVETVKKKMCLNAYDVINNKESNTKNRLNPNSVKKLEVPENYNHNFSCRSSNLKYPPPYPIIPPHKSKPSWKNVPPIPNMTIETSENRVTLTWDLNLTWNTANIKMYELFVCQETDAPPHISMWKKKGNIEADLLPMACELEVFDLGHVYHFALRAVDVHNRRAPFAVQKIKI